MFIHQLYSPEGIQHPDVEKDIVENNNLQKADLHLHSTASDGMLSPSQVVEEAARAGLAAMALSDHDTIGGIEEALEAGKRSDVFVVPAVEINTDYANTEIHILGYFIDWQSKSLRRDLDRLRDARLRRGMKMVDRLRAQGVPITLDRVIEIAGTAPIGRPHVACAIAESGAVDSIDAAFIRYLVRGAPAYVERMKFSPHEAITVIANAGGVAGMAHPAKSKRDNMIPELMKIGLGALEVHHTDHNAHDVRRYQALARKYALIPTGGSDSHGLSGFGSAVGSVTVDISIVHRLKEAAACKAL